MNSNSTDVKQIRIFGLVAFVFFGGLSMLGFWMTRPLPTWLFGTLSLIGFGFIVAPSLLKPVYETWLKIAHFIGRTITILMLTVSYYLVITPYALIMRLIKGSPLPLRPDRAASSYWIFRTEPVQPKERYIKRY